MLLLPWAGPAPPSLGLEPLASWSPDLDPLTPSHLLGLLKGGESSSCQNVCHTSGVGHLAGCPPQVEHVHLAFPPVPIPGCPEAPFTFKVVGPDHHLALVRARGLLLGRGLLITITGQKARDDRVRTNSVIQLVFMYNFI